jgi:ribulose-phosphate 3-epimerase
MQTYKIAASILSADFARLGEEVTTVLAAGADIIHFDVMDNHYVPNLTIGPMVCQALRNYGVTAPIDVHLMVNPVDRLIKEFAAAGASIISFHPEASTDVTNSLKLIRDHKCKSALALNPDTSLDYFKQHAEQIDMLLLMSVHPGFAGQAFIPETLDKVRMAKKFITEKKLNIVIEVDGGIKIDNVGAVAAAGADIFVAGSAIFNSSNYQKTMAEFRKELNKAS